MREAPQITWLRGAALSLAVWVTVLSISSATLIPAGPSDRPEAFFNGSSFIRINKPISLRHLVGLNFRSCVGGELFSQRYEGHTIHVTALANEVVVSWARPGQPVREEALQRETLDNRWHWVALRYSAHPPALMLQVDHEEQVIANTSLHPWLLSAERLQADGAGLLVGNMFSGCIHEGPQLEFHAATTTARHVEFGPCPLTTDPCKDKKDVLRTPPKDHCYNEPCLRHGTCISRHDRYECQCAARYTGNNCQVDRGPPCASSPCRHGQCQEDAAGNYRCLCDHNYHGVHCELQDSLDPACVAAPCKNNASCEVPVPGAPYVCLCPPGFTGRNCETDVDECAAAGNGACENGGRCVDAANTYSCDCTGTGYMGPRCETNVNECESARRCGPGACYDTYGGYVCVCPPPYLGDRCQQKSACASNPCANGSCSDSGAGFVCVCEPGWGGPLCAAPSACPDLCPPHSHCQPPLCVCDPGYYGVAGLSPVCSLAESACVAGVCTNGGTCRAAQGKVECTCPPGYRGQYCEISAGKALSLERCAHNPCRHATSCMDTATGFECTCDIGWGGGHCDTATAPATSCVARGDSFHCDCPPGYSGPLCDPVADCRTQPCPHHQMCVDSGGSWQCTDGPCVSANCNGGSCVAQDSTGYQCVCPPGMTGRFCELDIDECALKSKICNHGVCVNVVGSYECYCKPGYTGASCDQDIDECLSAPCKNNGTCQNLENNFECLCMKGFKGKDCSVDIDECESSPCSAGATCTDGIGTFTCTCPLGMTGRLCEINIDDCESEPCLHGGRCVDGVGSFSCECGGTGWAGATCDTNIDECASQPCRNGAVCQDHDNDYRCLCHAGFNGKNCEIDINECESSPCQYGGVCLERSNLTLYRAAAAPPEQVGPQPHMLLPPLFYEPFSMETAAGFECVCVTGTAGARCEVNVDECLSSPCRHGKCEDKVGGYACHCDAGFEGDHCDVDIDECQRYDPCDHGQCHDRRASYYCECDSGWGGRNCTVELQGCAGHPCKAGGTCRAFLSGETQHRYNCTCRPGHWGDTCDQITTMSLEKSSYAEVNTTREEGYDISFRFKTTLGSGLLAMGSGLTYFFLELSNGRLNLHSSLLNKWEGVFIGSNLNDSNWQKVFVTINSSHLVLAANEEQTIYPISQNEAYNSSVTSFPTTRLGSSLAPLTHGPNFFVGCFQDVVVNGQWVLPTPSNVSGTALSLLVGVAPSCPRTPQCSPNPCRSGGSCQDHWTAFTCHCPRPTLGHTCQYNYTAATFGHESAGSALVSVAVSEQARLAVHAALDISMFVRTRKPHGHIFYLGSAPGSPEETLVAASLKNGELLVHLRFNHTPEDYTVGGTRLDNGHIHLIQVVRNSTLVQVKLNGTEYFRKSISAAKQLDAQVLYIGGPPPSPDPPSPSPSPSPSSSPTAPLSTLDDEYFKGVIQDVQISNGVNVSVVEFFPLSEPGLWVPPSFGDVSVSAAVLPGVRSDDACTPQPCLHNATCTVTWNDYTCECPRGFKGKDCADVEFCQLQGCPLNSHCRNLQEGYECLSNATFDGSSTLLAYNLRGHARGAAGAPALSLQYRSQAGGTLLRAELKVDNDPWWFQVGSFGAQLSVSWQLPGAPAQRRAMRTARDTANWTTVSFSLTAHQIKGAFVWDGREEVGISAEMNTSAWRHLVTRGTVLLGGVRDRTHVPTTPLPTTTETVTDTTTVDWAGENSVGEFFKGCMGPVHINGMLLPFFSEDDLFVGNSATMLRAQTHYGLVSGRPWGADSGVGCVLCLEHECQHGARCADVRTDYRCHCPPGYQGDLCETDIDECQNHQCANGSTCRDGIAGYTCDCAPGYTGQLCESDIDECASSPCANGGVCTNSAGGYGCTCAAQWAGDTCGEPRHRSCSQEPCAHRARCVDGEDKVTGNNYTCLCPAGFEGVHCELAFCEAKPCDNGKCVVPDGEEPYCACSPGYRGVWCDSEIDECDPSPCLHHGLCQDRLAGYDCDCTGTGWQGVHCEEDVDECASGLVNCGPGQCRNHQGGYTCQCGEGYCGHECKLTDPCTVKRDSADPENNSTGPCLHGGRCQQRCAATVNFICDCVNGWGGATCEQQVVGSAVGEGGGSSAALVAAICGVLGAAGLGAAGLLLAAQARRKRATRGTYSPSGQEYCNPRAHTHLKPPPEERLI